MFVLSRVRRSVAEWIELHKRPNTAGTLKEIQARVHQISSKFLPEPVKAQEFLTKFSAHMRHDSQLLRGMEAIVSPDVSCETCVRTTVNPTNLFYIIYMYIMSIQQNIASQIRILFFGISSKIQKTLSGLSFQHS